jgi:DNA-binding transcriptional LysR family regulator
MIDDPIAVRRAGRTSCRPDSYVLTPAGTRTLAVASEMESVAQRLGRRSPGLRLCPLVPAPPAREIWLLSRRQDRKDLAIGTVVEYLTRLFADEQGLFEDSQ